MGAVYTALVGSILIVFLGWLSARKIVSVFNKKTIIILLKLLISSSVMGASVWWMRDEYSFLIVIPIGAVVYFIMLLLLRVWKREDLDWLRNVISNS